MKIRENERKTQKFAQKIHAKIYFKNIYQALLYLSNIFKKWTEKIVSIDRLYLYNEL